MAAAVAGVTRRIVARELVADYGIDGVSNIHWYSPLLVLTCLPEPRPSSSKSTSMSFASLRSLFAAFQGGLFIDGGSISSSCSDFMMKMAMQLLRGNTSCVGFNTYIAIRTRRTWFQCGLCLIQLRSRMRGRETRDLSATIGKDFNVIVGKKISKQDGGEPGTRRVFQLHMRLPHPRLH